MNDRNSMHDATTPIPPEDVAHASSIVQLSSAEIAAVSGGSAPLSEYQRDLGKYNRMFEMMANIMASSHEMKKALIANFPR